MNYRSSIYLFTELSRVWAFGLFFLCGFFSVQIVNAADSPGSAANSPISISNQIIRESNLLREQLSSAESEHGPYHLSLIEPLRGLTNLQIELENYQEAERLLNRQLQILRSVNGPTNLTQLSAIAELVKNDIRQQDWLSIIDNYQFIQWLYAKRPDAGIDEKLESLSNLASWHMAAVYLDHRDNRAQHFVEYANLLDQALSLAEEGFGVGSEATIPWIYKNAVVHYDRFSFYVAQDELRDQYINASGYNSLRNTTRSVALDLVENIADIVETSGSLEAQAMALVYRADFIKLRASVEVSSRLYRQARGKFLDAGIPEGKIDAFFAQPTILPMAKFHFSIDSAMEEQAPFDQIVEIDETSSKIFGITDFIALNESLPTTRRPDMPNLLSGKGVKLNSVLLQLSIGVDGHVDTAKVVGASPDEAKVRVFALNATGGFTFRTNPISRWWSAKQTVTLLYMYPDKNNGGGIYKRFGTAANNP